MLNLVNSTMADNVNDEVFDITSKNYEKVAKNLENSGYMEGVTDGRNSVYQLSFDKGYEDGFMIGYLLGITSKPKPSRGNCAICVDPSFMKKPVEIIREAHRKQFDEETAKTSN